jgi:hypothetical protein
VPGKLYDRIGRERVLLGKGGQGAPAKAFRVCLQAPESARSIERSGDGRGVS